MGYVVILTVAVFPAMFSGCSGQVNQLVSPINDAILATENVEFRCRVQQNNGLTSFINWDECITRDRDVGCRRISKDEDVQYVAAGGDPVRAERYSVSTGSTGEYNLNIVGAVLTEDAGSYVCRADNSAASFGYAELIILDGAPVCSRNTTNPNQAERSQYIRHVCEAPYRGRWAPIMTWDEAGIPINDVKDESETNVARYSITFEVTPQHNVNIYGARVFFQTPSDTTDNEATNAPSYSYNFQFAPLVVFFGPYDMTIDWDEGCMAIGAHVTCNTLGNPTPAYLWRDVNTTEIVSYDKTLTLTEEMLGHQTYKCEADNGYGRGAEEVINIQVCRPETPSPTTRPPVTTDSTWDTLATTAGNPGEPGLSHERCIAVSLVVGVMCVTLAVVLTFFITRRKCPGPTGKSSDESSGMGNAEPVYYNQEPLQAISEEGVQRATAMYEHISERGVNVTAMTQKEATVNKPDGDSLTTCGPVDMLEQRDTEDSLEKYITIYQDDMGSNGKKTDMDQGYETLMRRRGEYENVQPGLQYEAMNVNG